MTKFEDDSIDCCATLLPIMHENLKKQEKVLNELFFQLKRIMKPGSLGVFVGKIEVPEGFELVEEKVIMQGKSVLNVLVLKVL